MLHYAPNAFIRPCYTVYGGFKQRFSIHRPVQATSLPQRLSAQKPIRRQQAGLDAEAPKEHVQCSDSLIEITSKTCQRMYSSTIIYGSSRDENVDMAVDRRQGRGPCSSRVYTGLSRCRTGNPPARTG